MTITTRKYCAGLYIVSDGVNEVEVVSQDFGYGMEWMARALDMSFVYSDPLPTKREAKEAAINILKNWEELRKA
jgi:hypothetical protein